MQNQLSGALIASLLTLALSACGGGGGGTPAVTEDKKTTTTNRETRVVVRNLTLSDLPPKPGNHINNIFITDGNNNDTEPTGFCARLSRGLTCGGVIPNAADIRPLNDTNTGLATYKGSVDLSYINNLGSTFSDSERIRDITENIEIIANFGSNTLRYSGVVNTNRFSINGNFTSAGRITGSVNFASIRGRLIGLIGQTEMIGIFGGENGDYGGGFTAFRQ